MKTAVARATVDLSGHPDLVVIYLGLRVNALRGLATLFGVGPKLGAVARDKPDGLLAHESVYFGLRHIGFRQYWRDLESLEAFTRSEPHRAWWSKFLKEDAGAGFWHETYRLQGGMEAVYLNMPPIGFAAFAPEASPTGKMASTRARLSSPAGASS
jgi:hypothetical protein